MPMAAMLPAATITIPAPATTTAMPIADWGVLFAVLSPDQTTTATTVITVLITTITPHPHLPAAIIPLHPAAHHRPDQEAVAAVVAVAELAGLFAKPAGQPVPLMRVAA